MGKEQMDLREVMGLDPERDPMRGPLEAISRVEALKATIPDRQALSQRAAPQAEMPMEHLATVGELVKPEIAERAVSQKESGLKKAKLEKTACRGFLKAPQA